MKDNTGGILLIDKPEGVTSYDCVRAFARKHPGVKIGHAGTLDPLASGLLVIAWGAETKNLQSFLALPKTYEARVLLGEETDTGDREGKILVQRKIAPPSSSAVRSVLASLIGLQKLPVPLYSAVKVGGKPLYWYARKGISVTPPQKLMDIRTLTLRGITKDAHPSIDIAAEVGSGTYIRSLAVEIGKRLGAPATLTSLRRGSIGNFRIEDAEPLP